MVVDSSDGGVEVAVCAISGTADNIKARARIIAKFFILKNCSFLIDGGSKPEYGPTLRLVKQALNDGPIIIIAIWQAKSTLLKSGVRADQRLDLGPNHKIFGPPVIRESNSAVARVQPLHPHFQAAPFRLQAEGGGRKAV